MRSNTVRSMSRSPAHFRPPQTSCTDPFDFLLRHVCLKDTDNRELKRNCSLSNPENIYYTYKSSVIL
jgi:hypothetical protein